MVQKVWVGTYFKKKEQRIKPGVIIITLTNQGIIPLISFNLKKEIRTKKGTVSQEGCLNVKNTTSIQ